MSSYSPQTIHEATFLSNGRVIDQLSVQVGDLDAGWINYYEGLLAQGGGALNESMPQWRLVIQHQMHSFGVASLAFRERCLCSMLFLTGKNRREENRVIYQLLHHLATLPRDAALKEPDGQLLSIKQRPLLAVALFPGSDNMSSTFALDTSVFLAAAWFELHPD